MKLLAIGFLREHFNAVTRTFRLVAAAFVLGCLFAPFAYADVTGTSARVLVGGSEALPSVSVGPGTEFDLSGGLENLLLDIDPSNKTVTITVVNRDTGWTISSFEVEFSGGILTQFQSAARIGGSATDASAYSVMASGKSLIFNVPSGVAGDGTIIFSFQSQPSGTAPTISTQPSNVTVTAGGDATFSVGSSNATGYQWQLDQGAGFANIADGGMYAGSTTSTLAVNGASLSMNGYLYRVVVSGNELPNATSTGASLTVSSNNAFLDGLAINSGTLSPTFASGTTSYAASVGYGVSSVNVTPTVAQTSATVKVNGTTTTSGSAQAVSLSVGANGIPVVVTAPDGTTTKTYTLIITRAAASTNANLSDLSISQGVLSPAFASGTTSYTSSVPNNVTSLTVTPTKADANGSVTVNGVTVASGSASSSIALAVGTNTIATVVTAQDGSTTKTYTMSVTRAAAASTNANLSLLNLSNGTLSPTFASGTTSYSASVAYTVTSVNITPTVADGTATVRVNGTTTTSGNAQAVPLSVGSNSISVVVTAQDGATTITYIVNITRAAVSTDATLSVLSISQGVLSPAFAPGTTSYTSSVPNSITSLTVTPTKANANASIRVNGTIVNSGSASGFIALAVGANTVSTIVTAQDGVTTKSYTVTVTRAAPASTNATLSNLAIGSGTLSPTFSSGTTSYSASVAFGVTSVSITPTLLDSAASVTVNGTSTSSGSASAVPLAVGSNTVLVSVTAQDGTTTQYYTVLITRAAASADGFLSGYSISHGTLSPAFASGTTSYTAAVSYGVTSLTITPNTSSANASVTVNGASVTSGSASPAIPLAVGSNTIITVVTAQDGITTRTYTTTVTRATASSDANLSGLLLSSGTLSPTFASGTTSYTAAVGTAVTSVTVTSTVSDVDATVTVDGTAVTSGVASGTIPLNVGSNTITTTVTAQNGTTTQSYTVTVTRAAPPSTNANLSSLNISVGSLSPAFNSGTTRYAADVSNATTELTVTPEVADGTASVSVNGTLVTSGAPSGIIALNVGSNLIDVVATAADGTTTVTYAITVNRAAMAPFVFSPGAGPLPDGMTGEGYQTAISLSGTTGSVTFAITSGALPAGVILNQSTGELAGRITAPVGSYSFTLTATDSNGSASASYTLAVMAQKVVATDKEVVIQPGATPLPVDLTAGATGGPFTDAILGTVTPAQAGTAQITMGDVAAIGTFYPKTFYLKFIPNPEFSGTALVSYRLVSALGVSNTAAVTFKSTVDVAVVANTFRTLAKGFVSTRQSLLSSTISAPGLLERRAMATGAQAGTINVIPGGNSIGMKFASSLVQLQAWNQAGDAAGALAAVGNSEPSPFNVWIDASATLHLRADGPDDRWGKFAVVSVGADYLVNERLLVGLALHGDFMDDLSDTSKASGTGFLIGPNISSEVIDGVFVDASVLYGQSSNTLSTELFSGDFETQRLLANLKVEGEWAIDEVTTFRPNVTAVYLHESADGYTVANALGDEVAVSGFVSDQIRLSAGGKLEYVMTVGDGLTLVPHFGAELGLSAIDGRGLFDNPFGTLSGGFYLAGDGDWRLGAELEAGMDASSLRSIGAKATLKAGF